MTTTTQTQRPLIAGVLRAPMMKDLCPDRRRGTATAGAGATALAPESRGFSPAERDAVRRAAADRRDAGERTIDSVVDRLLRELTW